VTRSTMEPPRRRSRPRSRCCSMSQRSASARAACAVASATRSSASAVTASVWSAVILGSPSLRSSSRTTPNASDNAVTYPGDLGDVVADPRPSRGDWVLQRPDALSIAAPSPAAAAVARQARQADPRLWTGSSQYSGGRPTPSSAGASGRSHPGESAGVRWAVRLCYNVKRSATVYEIAATPPDWPCRVNGRLRLLAILGVVGWAGLTRVVDQPGNCSPRSSKDAVATST